MRPIILVDSTFIKDMEHKLVPKVNLPNMTLNLYAKITVSMMRKVGALTNAANIL